MHEKHSLIACNSNKDIANDRLHLPFQCILHMHSSVDLLKLIVPLISALIRRTCSSTEKWRSELKKIKMLSRTPVQLQGGLSPYNPAYRWLIWGSICVKRCWDSNHRSPVGAQTKANKPSLRAWTGSSWDNKSLIYIINKELRYMWWRFVSYKWKAGRCGGFGTTQISFQYLCNCSP